MAEASNSESTIALAEPERILSLFGARDQYIRLVRERFGVSITHRDGLIRIAGPAQSVTAATRVVEHLRGLLERTGGVTDDDVARLLGPLGDGEAGAERARIDVLDSTRRVQPRTPGQARYVQAIRRNELILAIGPAGTGKTYLAVALAVEALKQRTMRKIVLVRPAVEAGESLGFLPGDLQAKINPYLRPLLDALHEMMDYELIKGYMERDVIEVVPLAYMRGRTLNNSFTILDEAQNATVAQMKMFLTRMGEGSKFVVSGDITQVDLPSRARSGLSDALHRLRTIRGVGIVELQQADIVRHRLVQDIVDAYESNLRQHQRRKSGH